jgi:hypothetical protein
MGDLISALVSLADGSYIPRMCNDYQQHVLWGEYRKLMKALDLTIPIHQSELDLPGQTTSGSTTRGR